MLVVLNGVLLKIGKKIYNEIIFKKEMLLDI